MASYTNGPCLSYSTTSRALLSILHLHIAERYQNFSSSLPTSSNLIVLSLYNPSPELLAGAKAYLHMYCLLTTTPRAVHHFSSLLTSHPEPSTTLELTAVSRTYSYFQIWSTTTSRLLHCLPDLRLHLELACRCPQILSRSPTFPCISKVCRDIKSLLLPLQASC